MNTNIVPPLFKPYDPQHIMDLSWTKQNKTICKSCHCKGCVKCDQTGFMKINKTFLK